MNKLFKVTKIIESELAELDKRLIGSNYGVHFEIKFFEFNKKNNLNEYYIKMLFDEEARNEALKVEGAIQPIEFNIVQRLTNLHLRFTSDRDKIEAGYDWRLVYEDEWEKRKKMFWFIVEKYISLPPNQCYEYIPEVGSYFYDCFTFWYLNYIFLNDIKGIFIHICASD